MSFLTIRHVTTYRYPPVPAHRETSGSNLSFSGKGKSLSMRLGLDGSFGDFKN
jgi:hypothetical protein